MAILIDKNTKVICQGFTGKQGRATTDCPVDSRSLASAQTWMSGLVISAMDGIDNTAQPATITRYGQII